MTPEEQLEADIKEWKALGDWMAQAKEREAYLRKTIAERCFTWTATGAFKSGVSNAVQPGTSNNYGLRLNAQNKISICEELMAATLEEADLAPEQSAGLIKTEHKLSLTVYKKLPDAKRAIVDKMLVEKPGSIQLDVSLLSK